jgi:hypothetical protein
LKKEHRSIIFGGAMVTGGVFSMYLKHYFRVISLVQKGEIIHRKIKGIQTGGSTPRRVQARGAAPR